ncbi:MAG: tetratricopeptide repeat protein [Rhabdochlamydiaceae bacterium]
MICRDTYQQIKPFVEPLALKALSSFDKILRSDTLFHLIFGLLACLELISLILLSGFDLYLPVMAFLLGFTLLTIFCYFVLLFYFQAKKIEQITQVKDAYLKACLSVPLSTPFHLADCCLLIFDTLMEKEYDYYHIPPYFNNLSIALRKFSLWAHWKDDLQLKELLLSKVLEIYIDVLKNEPLDIHIHKNLAHIYETFSTLYLDPRKIYPEKNHLWVSKEFAKEKMHNYFNTYLKRCIQEQKIIKNLQSKDTETCLQLAYLYSLLGDIDQQIAEYEELITYDSDHEEALYNLACLYFQKEEKAEGLKIYEKLKNMASSRAELLINHY